MVHAEPSQASWPSPLVVVYVQTSHCPPSSPYGSLQLLTVVLTSVRSLDIAEEAVALLASLERGGVTSHSWGLARSSLWGPNTSFTSFLISRCCVLCVLYKPFVHLCTFFTSLLFSLSAGAAILQLCLVGSSCCLCPDGAKCHSRPSLLPPVCLLSHNISVNHSNHIRILPCLIHVSG